MDQVALGGVLTTLDALGPGPLSDWTGPPLPGNDFATRYAEDLELFVEIGSAAEETRRLVAGFCWKWSDPRSDSTLVDDVVIGEWRRPWNQKRNAKKGIASLCIGGGMGVALTIER